MDTATHITMGVAIGGLATLDPAVQQNTDLFHAVLIGAIIGSHAPDFDTFFKFKDNATYIRHHRGSSHSPLAVLLWSLLVTFSIYAFYIDIPWLNLWFWVLLSVALHVLVDIFNAYGTQALKPFVNKWIALGWINTFDPYIFGLFLIGAFAWILGADPSMTYLIVFFVVFLYYIKRFFDKKEITDILQKHFPNATKIITQPTIHHNTWRVVIETPDYYFVADSDHGHIDINDTFKKNALPDTTEMNAAFQDENVKAFIDFSPIYRYEIDRFDDYVEIRFIDLRYRSKGHYPFVAVVTLDKFYNVLTSYTGWVYSEEKLQKKLEPLS
ncbi:metal-dependent hydrolase [Alkalibacillus haloalkaliphilus]|uniref:metal-dependent hydrolase n=1 Tax=Alkalibacillus haloalkaliphilus TaxID=94136 RepID=UPI00293650EF|nr:metal-dependent hydrolase [Alkalibacillus haloalkaliphilus]MDV2581872.1 metal-dependent hydrolase [Alkalibacillus haloalkaliphilus]